MPVHLGSNADVSASGHHQLPNSILEIWSCSMIHPRGTHLPDITLVAPVYVVKKKNRIFYVASRAHHADVGGTYSGSMGLCREIYQEGFRIPPVTIIQKGKMNRDVLALLLNNVRTPTNAKETWARKSPPAIRDPSAYGRSAGVTD